VTDDRDKRRRGERKRVKARKQQEEGRTGRRDEGHGLLKAMRRTNELESTRHKKETEGGRHETDMGEREKEREKERNRDTHMSVSVSHVSSGGGSGRRKVRHEGGRHGLMQRQNDRRRGETTKAESTENRQLLCRILDGDVETA
jgi:hypothetical protein